MKITFTLPKHHTDSDIRAMFQAAQTAKATLLQSGVVVKEIEYRKEQ